MNITVNGYLLDQYGSNITIRHNGQTLTLDNPDMGRFIAALIVANQGEQPQLLTARAFARSVGKSPTAVRNAIKRGRIPGVINMMGDFLIPALAAEPGMIDWGKRGNPGRS